MKTRLRRARHAGTALVIPEGLPRASQPSAVSDDDDLAEIDDAWRQEAAATGAPVLDWWLARRAGLTELEAAELSALGARALLAGAVAARSGVATLSELKDAGLAKAVDLYAYVVRRDDGLGHEAALLLAGPGTKGFDACAQRYGNADTLAGLAEMPLSDYAALRRFATHDQALDAHKKDILPSGYLLAASAGASHDEIVAAASEIGDLWAYSKARHLGASHDAALAQVVATRSR